MFSIDGREPRWLYPTRPGVAAPRETIGGRRWRRRRIPRAELSGLRTGAEETLRGNPSDMEDISALSPEEIQRLVHELRLHQIMLEMQNEELREAQIKLEELKDRYLGLYDFAPVGLCTFNDKGLILDANLTAVGLLGVDRKTLIKKPFSHFVCKSSGMLTTCFFNRSLRAIKADLRNQAARKDGTHFYAQLESVAVQDESGRFNRCRTILSDITEQKQAEAWLRESEEKYRNLVETLSDVVFEVDRQGVITYCSPVVQHVLGYEPEDLMGRHHAEFVHSRDRDLLIKRFSELMQGIVHPLEYRMMTKSGEVRWVQSHTRPVMKGNTTRSTWDSADITERKKEQAALSVWLRLSRRLLKLS